IPVCLALLGGIAVWHTRGWKRTYPFWVFGGLCLAGAGLLLLARHMVIAASLYLLMMAVGIGSQRGPRAIGLLAVIGVVDLLSLAHFYGSPWSRAWPQDWAGAAQQIAASARADDVVAVSTMPGGAYAFTYQLWSIVPQLVRPSVEGQPGRLPAPVPSSWARMDPRATTLKTVYTWEVSADHGLIETTWPEFAAPDFEAERLRQQLCDTCHLWLIFDGGGCRDCQSSSSSQSPRSP